MSDRKNIAIIGTGISGLTAAYLLRNKHTITVYESEARLGGHTATKTVVRDHGSYAIDTGFIVFNDWTYPKFIRLMDALGVASQPTSMGFSAFYEDGRFEYSGDSLNTLFADRTNLVSVRHWRMLWDILRFNREAVSDWKSGGLPESMTLGQYLSQRGYSRSFIERYLVPMGAAIWSSSTRDMLAFPLIFFIRFFHNHGLLSVNQRPQWRVIQGGSQTYLAPLTQSFSERIRLADPVLVVQRTASGVIVQSQLHSERYDQVIFACHADQALRLLSDADAVETELLSALPYRDNQVVLHTDERLLPRRKRAWSSWNYRLCDNAHTPPVLTYNMNILQGLNSPETFCVTLNATDAIAPDKIIGRYTYAHPVFTEQGIRAQQQWQRINGVNRTWFCGAYWFNGFHEDGVRSACRVSDALGGEVL